VEFADLDRPLMRDDAPGAYAALDDGVQRSAARAAA
jgi:hypothetical protein